MKVLILPPKQILKDYYNDNRVVIVNRKQIIYNGNVIDKTNSSKVLEKEEFFKIRNMLKSGINTFMRWKPSSTDVNTYFYEQLDFAINQYLILSEFNIDKFIFFTSNPHHIETDTYATISEIMNIESIYLYNSVFDSKLVPISQKGRAGEKLIVDIGDCGCKNNSFQESVKSFFENSKMGKSPRANYKTKRLETSLTVGLGFLFKSYCINQLIKVFKKKKLAFNFLSELDFILNQAAYIRKYQKASIKDVTIKDGDVVISAHYQPESTSFPEGLPYNSHLEIISKLKRSGYKGKIYYKEHPSSLKFYDSKVGLSKVGLYRDLVYLKFLLDNGVVLLDLDFDLNKLSDNGVWVLTMTGSVALERAAKELPTIISGSPWYGCPPFCVTLDDFLSGNYTFSRDDILTYFKKLVGGNYLNNYFGIGKPTLHESGTYEDFKGKFERLIN